MSPQQTITGTRPTILAGNWKMNLLRADTTAFAAKLLEHLDSGEGSRRPTVMLFPSFPFLATLADRLRATEVVVGAQDLHPEPSGAHTGDVSARQIRSTGATWVLCGHSERRSDHCEGNQLVAAKTLAALGGDLAPMVCVGETLAQREAADTESVLEQQLTAVLDICPSLGGPDSEAVGTGRPWALAYEPVWAIGTGHTATPQIAQRAHSFLRSILAERFGGAAAQRVPLLYGGSAKPANCESLLAEADVDGLLIGGASLDSASFLDMIRRCG